MTADKNRVQWIQTTPLITQLTQRLDALEKRLAALENPAQPKVKTNDKK
jgi:polyhydroxyalkanoate synthesis regulator phasin